MQRLFLFFLLLNAFVFSDDSLTQIDAQDHHFEELPTKINLDENNSAQEEKHNKLNQDSIDFQPQELEHETDKSILNEEVLKTDDSIHQDNSHSTKPTNPPSENEEPSEISPQIESEEGETLKISKEDQEEKVSNNEDDLINENITEEIKNNPDNNLLVTEPIQNNLISNPQEKEQQIEDLAPKEDYIPEEVDSTDEIPSSQSEKDQEEKENLAQSPSEQSSKSITSQEELEPEEPKEEDSQSSLNSEVAENSSDENIESVSEPIPISAEPSSIISNPQIPIEKQDRDILLGDPKVEEDIPIVEPRNQENYRETQGEEAQVLMGPQDNGEPIIQTPIPPADDSFITQVPPSEMGEIEGIIPSPAIQGDQIAGPNSEGANTVSISNSAANNIKILKETLLDYEGLVDFSNPYVPSPGSNLIEEILSPDQISAIAQIANEFPPSLYDTPQQHIQDLLDLHASVRQVHPIVQGKCIEMNWFDTNMIANDIAVGSQGDVYAASVDGHLYSYDIEKNEWKKVKGNYDLGSIIKVSVDSHGTPYVVAASGGTFYLNEFNQWIKLPGCATDIAIGRGGEVYKIGCDVRPNGYGIFKLFNNEENENRRKNRKCLRKRGNCAECNFSGTDENEALKKYWFRLSGSGVRVSVSPSGLPYIVNSSGMIMSYEEANWSPILTTSLARDISISNDGEIFYSDYYHNIFRVINRNGYVYQMCGLAKAIAAGPFSQPFVIGADHKVYTVSQYGI